MTRSRFIPALWLVLLSPSSSSARVIRISVKRALLHGSHVHLLQSETDKPREYLAGFSQAADSAEFHIDAHSGKTYGLYCLCRVAVRKGMEVSVNAESISTILHPRSQGFALQYLGLAYLKRGENTIIVHKGWGGFELASLELRSIRRPKPPAPVHSEPSDIAVTSEARSLLRLLQADYGTTTLIGAYSDEDAAYTQRVTGTLPAIMGGDLMRYSPGFLRHAPEPQHEVERLMEAHRRGQIVTLSWHWASPLGERDTPQEPWFRSFYTEATTFDVRVALADTESPEHAALLSDIHTIAVQLRRLQDAGVPVLWRPLHEAEDQDFWWGAQGPEPFKMLWKLLYHQLTEVEGIHNLLWVFTSGGDSAWYPGDKYVDIVGFDGYPKDIHDPESAIWNELQGQFAGKRMLALSEFGGVPDLPRMQQAGEWWSYAVSWSGELGPRKNDPIELKQIEQSSGTGMETPPPQSSPVPAEAPSGPPIR